MKSIFSFAAATATALVVSASTAAAATFSFSMDTPISNESFSRDGMLDVTFSYDENGFSGGSYSFFGVAGSFLSGTLVNHRDNTRVSPVRTPDGRTRSEQGIRLVFQVDEDPTFTTTSVGFPPRFFRTWTDNADDGLPLFADLNALVLYIDGPEPSFVSLENDFEGTMTSFLQQRVDEGILRTAAAWSLFTNQPVNGRSDFAPAESFGFVSSQPAPVPLPAPALLLLGAIGGLGLLRRRVKT